MCFGPFRVLRPLCHWGPIITMTLVLFVTISAIFAYLEVYPPTSEYPARQVHFVVMLIWPCIILYNYFLAVFIGPGFVPLGWTPEEKGATDKLQYCIHCEGYKAPRSHHCRQCKRCVLKMDHHCPWINACVGHRNHTRFINFLFLAPLGCLHGTIIHGITIYVKMFQILYVASIPRVRLKFRFSTLEFGMYHLICCFMAVSAGGPEVMMAIASIQLGVASNPRIRHKFRFSTGPYFEFGMYHLICCFVAVGAALGVMIGVSLLLFIQLKVAKRNETGIENWIRTKAEARARSEDEGDFVYPYDLGWKKNMRQVIRWEGRPVGDGLTWPVVKGCDQYTLTIEQLIQKQQKKQRTIEYIAVDDYSGAWCPVSKGCCTTCRVPISEEPRIPIEEGDTIMVTRWKKYWLYGDKCLTEEDRADGVVRVRGWFPKQCVEKKMLPYTTDSQDESEPEETDNVKSKKNK